MATNQELQTLFGFTPQGLQLVYRWLAANLHQPQPATADQLVAYMARELEGQARGFKRGQIDITFDMTGL